LPESPWRLLFIYHGSNTPPLAAWLCWHSRAKCNWRCDRSICL